MSVKKGVAASIRVIRRMRGLGYEDLADASAQANLSDIEQGKTNVTLDKLIKLASALDFDPVTLVAIIVAQQKNATPLHTLEQSIAHLQTFQAAGGLDAIEAQFEEGQLTKRSRGKPLNKQNEAAVLELQAKGMSRIEVARELGLAKTTVQRYWQK